MSSCSRFTVLSIAYPFAPVGQDAVGGAEQVLSALDAALVAAGRRSIVIACSGSRTAGDLVELPPCGSLLDLDARAAGHAAVRRAIAEVLARERVDVAHMHGIDFWAYLPPPGVPVLATLHLPPSWHPPHAFALTRPDTWLHCVSASQHRACPECLHLLPPIVNGVEVAAFAAATHARRSFALMLGRVCPEKGQREALLAARAAGASFLMGGAVFPYREHRDYFEAEVAPLLDSRRRWLGPVGWSRKRRLLAAARCVLIPSLAPETSSLVAMEAAAAGTPVIAFPSGALADLVEHGRTGFLVADWREMASAIGRAGAIDPEDCRRAARARFDMARSVAEYFARYDQLAHTRPGRSNDSAQRSGYVS